MKIFCTLLFSLAFSLFSPAQSKFEEAKSDLQKLRNGMLLVRLQTAANKIDALVKIGRSEEAKAATLEQYRENKETILAFSQVFTFCPVYFFYADDSEEIRRGNLAGHIFNTDLVAAEDSTGLPEHYFTGEFAETTNLGIDGFILMDKDLIPLESPFPFFQRRYILFNTITLSKAKILDRYNAKLQRTYEMWF